MGKNYKIELSDRITIRENIGFKKYLISAKKFLSHVKQGWFSSNNIKKHPDGVDITQIVDRENNFYKKKVIDKKTGKIIKGVEEPLNQHRNR